MRGIFKRESHVVKRKIKKSPPYEGLLSLFQGKYNSGSGLVIKTKAEPDNFIELDDASCQPVEQAAGESVIFWTTETETSETESAEETVSAEDIIEFEPKVANDASAEASTALFEIPDLPLDDVEEVITNFHSNLDARVAGQRSFLHNMAFFVCRDRHPLQIIQAEGFKHLISELCPGSKLPSVDELGTLFTTSGSCKHRNCANN
ncbi:uncharacterized protein LOC111074619 [Drosophila obscura]|uniref:uncharacterized protein LOC111074619 n=1 Tax=Drosophila obscura TaxID=7282 RepID=UPI001BB0D8F4|nr:uncharacterized protein LOC111074619 [Drosophila obscura]